MNAIINLTKVIKVPNKKIKEQLITYNDTKFVNMLKRYGRKRIVKSLDIKLASILTVVFLVTVYYFGVANQLIDMFATYATIASGMVAIIIAALAIIVSMSDEKFISFISQEPRVYRNILFLFWYASILAGTAITVNIVGFVITKITPDVTYINLLLLTIGTFLTTYAVFAVIMAVGSVMRFGLYRAEFTRIKNDNS